MSPHDTARLDELLTLVKAQGEQITALTQKIDEMQRRLLLDTNEICSMRRTLALCGVPRLGQHKGETVTTT